MIKRISPKVLIWSLVCMSLLIAVLASQCHIFLDSNGLVVEKKEDIAALKKDFEKKYCGTYEINCSFANERIRICPDGVAYLENRKSKNASNKELLCSYCFDGESIKFRAPDGIFFTRLASEGCLLVPNPMHGINPPYTWVGR